MSDVVSENVYSKPVETNYDIDWSMLDKKLYFPLSLLSTFTIRCLLYPFTLVRTRLQVQVQQSIYNGTWDALKTTVKLEGFHSLYRGFWIYSYHLIPGLLYITTFEATRLQASNISSNTYIRSAIGGGFASLTSQVLAVPIDVVSQHMMLVGLTTPSKSTKYATASTGSSTNSFTSESTIKFNRRQINRIHVPEDVRTNNYRIFKHICQTLLYEYKQDGKILNAVKPFYRGYILSSALFGLTSSIWWPAYYFYQNQLLKIDKFYLPLIIIQCISGPLSSLTSTLLTNPLDVCRTRVQVDKDKRPYRHIIKQLWQEERMSIFTKGLTARLTHSCIYSLFVIFGYETVKRLSLKEEYKSSVRW